ncbi:kanadaptin [Stigmatopora nigra]
MAAAPTSEQLDSGAMKMDERDTNSVMEIEECSVAENKPEEEKKELAEVQLNTAPLFKKPAALVSKATLDVVAAPFKAGDEAALEKESKRVPDVHGEGSLSADSDPSPESSPDGGQRPEGAPGVGGGGGGDGASVVAKAPNKHKVPPAGKFPPLPYTEPHWGTAAPADAYSLEVVKNGTIVDKVPLAHRSFFAVGRLPVCDVSLEHPSISRYHAIIQYRRQAGHGDSVDRDRGFYIRDLGSTHGTVLNKNKIPPETYVRLRVGHVLKFGGSTRLFVLQGPESDEEEESDLTVTELRERGRKQRAELEKRMMGEGSDQEEGGEKEDGQSANSSLSGEDAGCSWGMEEEHLPEEDDNEENPFSTEFREDQEAAYLKDPKKALQGFYEREGEELEFEYEDKSHGSWLCRIKLPLDDASGRQLVAEVTHAGKKKEAALQCCLEACRMLEARGVLRQEAVSRKRKKKDWEEQDYYDSDDDIFLDRTGTVEKKRKDRMKRAGKMRERPDTHQSLLDKLSQVEKEVAETQEKLGAPGKDAGGSWSDDPLDAFMSAVRGQATTDAVERRKLHLHVAHLQKDAGRLRKLVELTRPPRLPSPLPGDHTGPQKAKKALPLFGAMKGGSKFKLKTGTIGKLPPKQPKLPAELFVMKEEVPPGGEVEEEEDEEEEEEEEENKEMTADKMEALKDKECHPVEASHLMSKKTLGDKREKAESEAKEPSPERSKRQTCTEAGKPVVPGPPSSESGGARPAAGRKPRKVPSASGVGGGGGTELSAQYPRDDPDYCVWLPPAGQTGDGRTHLNDKYGY